MDCIKCKLDIPAGSAFCMHCGTNQAPTEKPKRTQKNKTRGNGQGTVYRRGKTWTASVTKGHRLVDGIKQPRRITKGGFATKTEALKYLPILEGKQSKEPPTLASLFEIYENGEMTKLSMKRQRGYQSDRKKLEQIAHIPIHDLTLRELQSCINDKTKTHAPARQLRSLASNLYQLAMGQQAVFTNLAQLVTIPEEIETEQHPFLEDEVVLIWQDYAAGNVFTGYILLMIYTGMMPGELRVAEKDMIDWKSQTIIGCGKKTKERKTSPIVLADFIIPVLKDLCAATKGNMLLDMPEQRFYKTYYATLDRIGVRPLRPYSCRHTTASALALMENTPPSIIQKIMRQSDFKSTKNYIHIEVAPMLTALNRMPTNVSNSASNKTE